MREAGARVKPAMRTRAAPKGKRAAWTKAMNEMGAVDKRGWQREVTRWRDVWKDVGKAGRPKLRRVGAEMGAAPSTRPRGMDVAEFTDEVVAWWEDTAVMARLLDAEPCLDLAGARDRHSGGRCRERGRNPAGCGGKTRGGSVSKCTIEGFAGRGDGRCGGQYICRGSLRGIGRGTGARGGADERVQMRTRFRGVRWSFASAGSDDPVGGSLCLWELDRAGGSDDCDRRAQGGQRCRCE